MTVELCCAPCVLRTADSMSCNIAVTDYTAKSYTASPQCTSQKLNSSGHVLCNISHLLESRNFTRATLWFFLMHTHL